MGFKENFVWGAATAAYQVEGGYNLDGKGLNVWDVLCKKQNFIKDNHNGNTACDHYHRYIEDVKLMSELGIKAYRFSISWARILPDGIGRINQEGINFYDGLINELLLHGITPYVTLFHWDYPYELYKKGGWLNKDSPSWFEEYTKVVVDCFSDRVKHWMTLNEPQCYIGLGHESGMHAPGLKLPLDQVLLATHNTLLAHGKAVKVIRENAKLAPIIGYAPVGVIKIPKTESLRDIEAARKATFEMETASLWNNTWWMDPVFLGEYPADGLKIYEPYMPIIKQNDMKIIGQPLDFCGANMYNGASVSANIDGGIVNEGRSPGFAETSTEWPVTPECLYWGPKFLYERYKKPILITENGMANNDWISLGGKVHDPQRIDFMHRYLMELRRAVDDGIDIMGYMYWTLLDNFEWAEGYHKRFGLIHVDFDSKVRTIKDSALWYKNTITTNGKLL